MLACQEPTFLGVVTTSFVVIAVWFKTLRRVTTPGLNSDSNLLLLSGGRFRNLSDIELVSRNPTAETNYQG